MSCKKRSKLVFGISVALIVLFLGLSQFAGETKGNTNTSCNTLPPNSWTNQHDNLEVEVVAYESFSSIRVYIDGKYLVIRSPVLEVTILGNIVTISETASKRNVIKIPYGKTYSITIAAKDDNGPISEDILFQFHISCQGEIWIPIGGDQINLNA